MEKWQQWRQLRSKWAQLKGHGKEAADQRSAFKEQLLQASRTEQRSKRAVGS